MVPPQHEPPTTFGERVGSARSACVLPFCVVLEQKPGQLNDWAHIPLGAPSSPYYATGMAVTHLKGLREGVK